MRFKRGKILLRNMTDSDTEALRRQLEELKRENQQLKGKSPDASSDHLIITEGEYSGYPTLTFQRGNKKPFNIGLKKLKAVIEGREEVERFIQKHEVTTEFTNEKKAPGPATSPHKADGANFKIDDFLA
jgi:hypothetical protein